MTDEERDPILDRLRNVDPARTGDADEQLVRATVKQRGERSLGSPSPTGRRRPTRLLVAGAAVLVAAALVILVAGGVDGLSPGPERALAIQKGPKGLTLTIEEPGASAEEMNRELEAAGIDRVRVFTVPGSPNHAGTWAGEIELATDCEGGPTRIGYGVRIPYHTIDTPPAPGRDFLDLELPHGSNQAIGAGVVLSSGSGKRAIVDAATKDGATYAPAVLVAIRPPLASDGPDAKAFGVDQLAELGGDFEPYAQALSDGHADCEELGFKPPAPPSAGDEAADRLIRQGPVVGRCVVKVLGTGLFSIEGDVTDSDARRIHACSARIAHAARREHEQLRARREHEVEQIDSVADLPASVRAHLDPNRSTERAPHGGVKPNEQGTDTGTVVLSDYDGHDHRLSPKRPGQYVNLLCAARGGKDEHFYATTFFENEPVANARVSCRPHGPPRANHVVKLSELGVYEIHLNGAGFDDFVIRAPSASHGAAHPHIMRPRGHG